MRRESLIVLTAIWRRLACVKEKSDSQQDAARVAKKKNENAAVTSPV